MITAGLVGGIACGKSLVAAQFQQLGACVLDGDRAGHGALTQPEVKEALVARWGSSILDDEGRIDRSKVAEIVFAEGDQGAKELKFLESVTHPAIAASFQRTLKQAHAAGRFPVAILDAAVLIKAGWDKQCDALIFVDAPHELRLRRAVLRGLSPEQFDQREAAQTPVEEKRARADFVIDNSETPRKTFLQVQQVWQSLTEIA